MGAYFLGYSLAGFDGSRVIKLDREKLRKSLVRWCLCSSELVLPKMFRNMYGQYLLRLSWIEC
jgi:hypothetical protein